MKTNFTLTLTIPEKVINKAYDTICKQITEGWFEGNSSEFDEWAGDIFGDALYTFVEDLLGIEIDEA